jgi:alpha-beta hydrolase superfamily lysophospholipase
MKGSMLANSETGSRSRGNRPARRLPTLGSAALAAALLIVGLWITHESPLARVDPDGVATLPPASRAPAAAAKPPSLPFDSAVAMIARRQAGDDRVAVPGARSILLTRDARTARAIVLLHGLTDSPRQFEALAYLIHADGNNVFVPRFPQHGLRGGDAGALAALTASALRGFADSVVNEASGLGDSVVVVGLSMGGTVAAWIAQRREVWRAVLVAPALEPGRIPSILDRPIVGLADRLPNVTRRSPRDAASAVPRTRRIALLVNANDRTVRESAAEALARRWARHGAAVSVLELPDSLRLPHNIIDPRYGRAMGDAVLDLLSELTYGELHPALVRPLPVR